jgi:hypothetical protein
LYPDSVSLHTVVVVVVVVVFVVVVVAAIAVVVVVAVAAIAFVIKTLSMKKVHFPPEHRPPLGLPFSNLIVTLSESAV